MDEITILIIEDDEDIRESVKILLENEGFHVIEADNGMDGLHQISEDTDLVILDIMMPGILVSKPVNKYARFPMCRFYF